jgi:inhibitor of cysteine peptidase
LVDRAFSESDNGSSVTIPSGESFVVRLNENATTGYRWTLDPSVPQSLTLVSEQHHAPAQGGIGAGGTAQFEFAVVAAGNARLALSYKRAWEDRALETFTIQVSS